MKILIDNGMGTIPLERNLRMEDSGNMNGHVTLRSA